MKSTSTDERCHISLDDGQFDNEFAVSKVRSLKKIANIDDYYRFNRKIGSGSFGCVYNAIHIKLGINCAIKVISKALMSESEIRKERMMNELLILEKVNH